LPALCVLDFHDVDRLLEKLRSVHGEPRYDVAPELEAATRAAARLQATAQEPFRAFSDTARTWSGPASSSS
jgi:hypothetical protein